MPSHVQQPALSQFVAPGVQPSTGDEALPEYCVGSAHMALWSGSHGPSPPEQHDEETGDQKQSSKSVHDAPSMSSRRMTDTHARRNRWFPPCMKNADGRTRTSDLGFMNPSL